MIYIIGTCIMVVFGLTYDYLSQNSCHYYVVKRVLWMMYTIPLMAIAMFRYDVGTDYKRIYWNFYEAASVGRRSVMASDIQLDVGLYYFNRILLHISRNPVLFFVVSSLIIYMAVFVYIKRTNERIALPTLFFVLSGLYFTSFNVVRQFLALAIVLMFWNKLQNRRFFTFFIACILASCFHLSVIIVIALFFLKNLKINRKLFVEMLVISVVAMPLLGRIVDFLVANTRYKYYLSSNMYVVDGDYSGAIYAFIISAFLLFMYDRIQYDKDMNIWIWTLLIYDIVIIGSFFFPLCNRVAIYFKFFVFVNLLPGLVNRLQKNKPIVCGVVVVFLVSSVIFMYYFKGISNVFPYTSIIEIP